jgi:CMP/dCMP kinase
LKIAISGHSGCGNTTATSNVGKSLKLKVMNYTFRDLAKDLGMSFEDLHAQAPTNFIFDYLTDLVLSRFALSPDVVVGTRLAAWLMDADLRIWLQSSYEQVLYKTLKRDEQNRKRYLQLYGIDINDHSDFDITINTDLLTAEQVSGLIEAAAKWASINQLDRKNVHITRIRELIAENLELPFEALIDLNYQIDVKTIFQKIKKI